MFYLPKFAFILVAPIFGALFSHFRSFIFRGVVAVLFGSFFCITGGIPTLFASFCWKKDSSLFVRFFINIFVPITCFLLFIFHPSVQFGWWFGCYWFIPVLIFILKFFGFIKNGPVETAFRSTFVAHAIGSVMWCYFVSTSPAYWLSLTYVVAAERLVIASGMVFVFAGIKFFEKNKGVFYAASGYDYGWQQTMGKRKEI
jgi:hypothetical protein